MRKDSVISIEKPAEFEDELTVLLRKGARQLLLQAVEAELEVFLERYKQVSDPKGRRAVVRNGHLPAREILTGLGPVQIQVPRTRDRSGSGICFRSSDFNEALGALLGENAKGLSQPTISRLKEKWTKEYEDWCKRDLRGKRYVYLWADGVYFVRSDDVKQCILVIIGAKDTGEKEFIAIEDGYRESEQGWYEVLIDLRCNSQDFI